MHRRKRHKHVNCYTLITEIAFKNRKQIIGTVRSHVD